MKRIYNLEKYEWFSDVIVNYYGMCRTFFIYKCCVCGAYTGMDWKRGENIFNYHLFEKISVTKPIVI